MRGSRFSHVPLQIAFGGCEFLPPEALWLYYAGGRGWVSVVKGAKSKPVPQANSARLRWGEVNMVWWLFHVPIGTGTSSSDIPSLCTHQMCSPLLRVSSHHKLHPRAAERGGSLTEGQCPGLSFSILTFQYLSLARTRLLSFLRAYLDLEVIHSPI